MDQLEGTYMRTMINVTNETKNNRGELHSFDDKPAVVYDNGDKWWYKEGKLHRVGGPAVDWTNGAKGWYKEGYFHRIDGPACECSDGSEEWFYEGKEIKCNSTEEFLKIIELKAFW